MRRPRRPQPANPRQLALEDFWTLTPTEYQRIAAWLMASPAKRWWMTMPIIEVGKLADGYRKLMDTVTGRTA